MRITIVALGSRGDVQPFVPLGRGLQAAGHHVRVATFEDFGELIRSAGREFSPVRGDAQALLGAASQNGDLIRHQNPLLAFRALQRSYGTLAQNLADDLTGALRGSDLLLNQLPGNLFGPELAEFLHIPLAIVSVIPLAATATGRCLGFLRCPGK